MRVERALDKLNALLGRRGIHSTATALALALGHELGAAAPAGLGVSISSAALEGAASGAGPGTLIALKCMSATKFTFAVTAVAITALGTAFYVAHSARVTADAVAATPREQDRSRAGVPPPKKTAASAPPESGTSKSTPPSVSSQVPALRPPQSPPPPGGQIPPDRLAGYHRRFDAFVRQRDLAPEQADRLFAILNDWDEARNDFQASIRAEGLTATPEAQKLRDQLQHNIEVAPLVALLGDEGMRAYFEFERTSAFRSVVEPLAQALAREQLPLSDDQFTALTDLVLTNFQTAKRDPTAMGSEVVIDWTAVLTKAGSFLNPTQIALLQAKVARSAGTR